MRLGIIDVGSNTVHLSIIDGSPGTPPLPSYSTKRRLHLAESVGEDGALSNESIGELIETLQAASEVCDERGVDEVMVMATAVIRDATNCNDILSRVEKEADVALQVLSG